MPNKSNVVILSSDLLPIDDAIRYILSYFQETIDDKHGRYISWEHCYNAFCDNRGRVDESTIDYLSLHLAFYLASWGMYRGSSFLLQKDYKVHIPIIHMLQDERYAPLCGITATELLKESNLDLLEEISCKVRSTYAKYKPCDKNRNNITDTLVTKILLGAFGCVPAYDRYYVQTVKKYNISSGRYSRNSVKAIARYYETFHAQFEQTRGLIRIHNTDYPPMKLMDMCMWQAAHAQEQYDAKR